MPKDHLDQLLRRVEPLVRQPTAPAPTVSCWMAPSPTLAVVWCHCYALNVGVDSVHACLYAAVPLIEIDADGVRSLTLNSVTRCTGLAVSVAELAFPCTERAVDSAGRSAEPADRPEPSPRRIAGACCFQTTGTPLVAGLPRRPATRRLHDLRHGALLPGTGRPVATTSRGRHGWRPACSRRTDSSGRRRRHRGHAPGSGLRVPKTFSTELKRHVNIRGVLRRADLVGVPSGRRFRLDQ
jgi:hypothetical protein